MDYAPGDPEHQKYLHALTSVAVCRRMGECCAVSEEFTQAIHHFAEALKLAKEMKQKELQRPGRSSIKRECAIAIHSIKEQCYKDTGYTLSL